MKAIDGKPVLNARRSVKVQVTGSDIAKADVKDPGACAVARACRRELHAKQVRVHLARVYVQTNDGTWTRYCTPPAMRSELIAFDRGGKFSPGEFELIAPAIRDRRRYGKRQGGKPKYKQARYNPNRKKRAAPHIVEDVRIGPAP